MLGHLARERFALVVTKCSKMIRCGALGRQMQKSFNGLDVACTISNEKFELLFANAMMCGWLLRSPSHTAKVSYPKTPKVQPKCIEIYRNHFQNSYRNMSNHHFRCDYHTWLSLPTLLLIALSVNRNHVAADFLPIKDTPRYAKRMRKSQNRELAQRNNHPNQVQDL